MVFWGHTQNQCLACGLSLHFSNVPRKRDRVPKSRSVKQLDGIKMLECPNQFKNHSHLVHLLDKIDVKSWFTSTGSNLYSERRVFVFERLCPAQILVANITPSKPN